MKADYLRYIAEVRIDDAKSKAADNARFAYQEATNVAEKELAATHSVAIVSHMVKVAVAGPLHPEERYLLSIA